MEKSGLLLKQVKHGEDLKWVEAPRQRLERRWSPKACWGRRQGTRPGLQRGRGLFAHHRQGGGPTQQPDPRHLLGTKWTCAGTQGVARVGSSGQHEAPGRGICGHWNRHHDPNSCSQVRWVSPEGRGTSAGRSPVPRARMEGLYWTGQGHCPRENGSCRGLRAVVSTEGFHLNTKVSGKREAELKGL